MVNVDDTATKATAEECFQQLKLTLKHPFRFFYSNGDGMDGFGATWCCNVVMNNDDNPVHAKYYLTDGDVGNPNTQYTVASYLKNYVVMELGANAWFYIPLNLKSISFSDDNYTPGSSFSNIREIKEDTLLGLPILIHIEINL